MSRFEVKVRTFKNDKSVVRTVETIAKNSIAAGCNALQALGVDNVSFSLYVKPMEVRREAN